MILKFQCDMHIILLVMKTWFGEYLESDICFEQFNYTFSNFVYEIWVYLTENCNCNLTMKIYQRWQSLSTGLLQTIRIELHNSIKWCFFNNVGFSEAYQIFFLAWICVPLWPPLSSGFWSVAGISFFLKSEFHLQHIRQVWCFSTK